MPIKRIFAVLAMAALAIPLAAQGPFGARTLSLSGIWHPVVGSGSAYEMTDPEGKKSQLELTVVGQEDAGGKPGYWMEAAMPDQRSGGTMYVKYLMAPGDDIRMTVLKMIMQQPGQDPMEMDANMLNMMGRGRGGPAQNTPTDVRSQAELVGTESVTVPAGTFSCDHYHMKDGSGDAWVSDKVAPWGLVKGQGKDKSERSIVLVKVITDAKDHITGTPRQFDPSQFLRGGAGRGQ